MPANLLKRSSGTDVFLRTFKKFFVKFLFIESVWTTDFVDSPEDFCCFTAGMYIFKVTNVSRYIAFLIFYNLRWNLTYSLPSRHLLVQSQQQNGRKMCEICPKLISDVNDVKLLTLNRFHNLFRCFHCWLRTSKCQGMNALLNLFKVSIKDIRMRSVATVQQTAIQNEISRRRSTNSHYLEVLIITLNRFSQKYYFEIYFFYKQLGSCSNPQSYLYLQGFQGSELLNACLVVWPYKQILSVFQKFFSIRYWIDIVYTVSQRSKKLLWDS